MSTAGKIMITVLLFLVATVYAGTEAFIQMEIDSLYANSNLCKDREHIVVPFYLVNENVEPLVVDYADSTVVYYYEDNKQLGIIGRCRRCGKLILPPVWQQPLQKTTWKRNDKETDVDPPSDSTDN